MNAISEFLVREDMSQTEFGEKLGVGQGMVNQWVNGRRPVSIERALDIEEKFGINSEKLNPQITEIIVRLSKIRKCQAVKLESRSPEAA